MQYHQLGDRNNASEFILVTPSKVTFLSSPTCGVKFDPAFDGGICLRHVWNLCHQQHVDLLIYKVIVGCSCSYIKDIWTRLTTLNAKFGVSTITS